MDFGYEIQHFLDLEDVSREELKWEEEQVRCEARLQLLKRWKLLQIRCGEDAKRAQRLETLASTAFARRVETIVANEEAIRCDIAQNEHIRLEGALRYLDKRMREDILSAAYTIQQRLKYLNKTIDMVLKKEVTNRKGIHGAERYEWLVKMQKFDAQSTKYLRREVIEKVRREKQIKHDRFRRVAASGGHDNGVEWQNVDPPLENSFASDGKLSGSASSQLQPHPPLSKTPRSRRKEKTVSRFNASDFSLLMDQLSLKEVHQRDTLSEEAYTAFQVIDQLRNHLTARDIASHLPQSKEEIETKFARRIYLLVKQEQKERQSVEESCVSSWMGVERRVKRARLGEAKVTECVQMRQLTHDAKLQARYQRIAHQQQAFAERERAAVADLAAIKQDPPALLQTITVLPAGAKRARKGLCKEEERCRMHIVQEQSTFVHLIHTNMLKEECNGDLGEAKERAARSRRDRKERSLQDTLIRGIEESNDKHTLAVDDRRAEKKLKIDVERVQREEQAGRVKVNYEVSEWIAGMLARLRVASRMSGLLIPLEQDERRTRASLKSQERCGRTALLAFSQSRTRQQIRLPAPPLPLPPAKFEAARRLYATFSASHSNHKRTAKFSAPESKSSRLPPLADRYKIRSTDTSSSTAAVSPRRPMPESSPVSESARPVSPNLLLEIEEDM